ncbi:MAG: hypothetical protein WBF87_12965 [Mesorhizobium sp.]
MSIVFKREGAVVSLVGEAPEDERDGERYVEALTRISAERGPFVLLIDIRVEINMTHDQRKVQNLWYKRDRKLVESLCRACSLVRPAADEKMQEVWQSLFDFPLLVTRERSSADAFLKPYCEAIASGSARA